MGRLSDLAQRVASASAMATKMALRNEDPAEVARLCAFIDEECELPAGTWGRIVAGLVHEKPTRRPYRRRGTVEEPEPDVAEASNLEQPADVPIWMR